MAQTHGVPWLSVTKRETGEREKERETDRQTERERETEIERERERQERRERERRNICWHCCIVGLDEVVCRCTWSDFIFEKIDYLFVCVFSSTSTT